MKKMNRKMNLLKVKIERSNQKMNAELNELVKFELGEVELGKIERIAIFWFFMPLIS